MRIQNGIAVIEGGGTSIFPDMVGCGDLVDTEAIIITILDQNHTGMANQAILMGDIIITGITMIDITDVMTTIVESIDGATARATAEVRRND